VLLTGYADETARLEDQGAFFLLRKPTSGQEILRRLESLLAQRPPA
jgi:hypothetical protein